jgi:hypothetical protein
MIKLKARTSSIDWCRRNGRGTLNGILRRFAFSGSSANLTACPVNFGSRKLEIAILELIWMHLNVVSSIALHCRLNHHLVVARVSLGHVAGCGCAQLEMDGRSGVNGKPRGLCRPSASESDPLVSGGIVNQFLSRIISESNDVHKRSSVLLT